MGHPGGVSLLFCLDKYVDFGRLISFFSVAVVLSLIARVDGPRLLTDLCVNHILTDQIDFFFSLVTKFYFFYPFVRRYPPGLTLVTPTHRIRAEVRPPIPLRGRRDSESEGW